MYQALLETDGASFLFPSRCLRAMKRSATWVANVRFLFQYRVVSRSYRNKLLLVRRNGRLETSHGLEPFLVQLAFSFGSFGTEHDIYRSICVHDRLGVTTDRRQRIAVLQLRPAQRVVYDDGSEIVVGTFGRNV